MTLIIKKILTKNKERMQKKALETWYQEQTRLVPTMRTCELYKISLKQESKIEFLRLQLLRKNPGPEQESIRERILLAESLICKIREKLDKICNVA